MRVRSRSSSCSLAFSSSFSRDSLSWDARQQTPPPYLPESELDLTHTPAPCPVCGVLAVVPIIYNYPPPEAAAARGECVVGGCLVGEGSPLWHCRACHAYGGRMHVEPSAPRSTRVERRSVPARQPSPPKLLTRNWVLTRGGQRAECEIWSQGDGEELRLPMPNGGLARAHVSPSRVELLKMQQHWCAELEQQGWTKIWAFADYPSWPGEC
jgi:hypothetical protein